MGTQGTLHPRKHPSSSLRGWFRAGPQPAIQTHTDRFRHRNPAQRAPPHPLELPPTHAPLPPCGSIGLPLPSLGYGQCHPTLVH